MLKILSECCPMSVITAELPCLFPGTVLLIYFISAAPFFLEAVQSPQSLPISACPANPLPGALPLAALVQRFGWPKYRVSICSSVFNGADC